MGIARQIDATLRFQFFDKVCGEGLELPPVKPWISPGSALLFNSKARSDDWAAVDRKKSLRNGFYRRYKRRTVCPCRPLDFTLKRRDRLTPFRNVSPELLNIILFGKVRVLLILCHT